MIDQVPISIDRKHSANVLTYSPPEQSELPTGILLYWNAPAA